MAQQKLVIKAPKHWGESGSIVVVAAVSTVIILMFFGFVINVGYVYLWHDRGQNTADAAALAAIKSLDQTDKGLEEAREVAAKIVRENEIIEGEFSFRPRQEVVFGIWDEEKDEFTPSDNPLAINAIRIHINQESNKGNAVPIFLSSFFGKKGVDVHISAIAHVPPGAGTPSESPTFPIAVSSCGVRKKNSQALACGREVIIGDDDRSLCKTSNCVVDKDGKHFVWTLGENNTSFGTNDVRGRSNDIVACLKGNKRACSRSKVRVSSRIGTKSGNKCGAFNSNNAAFPRFLSSKKRKNRGKGVIVQVPVFEVSDCGDPSFFSQSNRGNNNSSSRSSRSSSRSDSCRNNNRRNNRGRNNRGCQSSRSSSSRSSSSRSSNKPEEKKFRNVDGIASLEIKSIRSTGNQKYIRAVVKCDVVTPDPAVRPNRNNDRSSRSSRSSRSQRSDRGVPNYGTTGQGRPRLCGGQ